MIEVAEFIESAKRLKANRTNPQLTEIDYRNIASRAYYGAHHACAHLVKKHSLHGIGSAHERIIDALIKNQKFKTIGNRLEQCRLARVKADYKLAQPFTLQEAGKQLKKSEKILDEVNCILSSKSA